MKQLKAKKGKSIVRNPLKKELDEVLVLQKKKDKLNIKLKIAESEAALAQAKFIDVFDDLHTACGVDPRALLDSNTGTKWVFRGQLPDGTFREVPVIEEGKKLKVVEQPKEQKVEDKAVN